MIGTVDFKARTRGTQRSSLNVKANGPRRSRTNPHAKNIIPSNELSDSDSSDIPIISVNKQTPNIVELISDSSSDSESDSDTAPVQQIDWGARNRNEVIPQTRKPTNQRSPTTPAQTSTRKRRRVIKKVEIAPPQPPSDNEEAGNQNEEEEAQRITPQQRQPERRRKRRVIPRSPPPKELTEEESSAENKEESTITSSEEKNGKHKLSVAPELRDPAARSLSAESFGNQINQTQLYEVIRKKKLFGEPDFSIIDHDRTIVFSRFEKTVIGSGYRIFTKEKGNETTLGFMRIHQHKSRFTYYSGDPNANPGEFYGLFFCEPREGDPNAKQIRLVFKNGFQLNYPATKEENLSRIALRIEDPKEEEALDKNQYTVIYTMIPHKTEKGILRLNFDGADVRASTKNFVIRDMTTKKCIIMFFRQSADMFKVRFAAPFAIDSAFAFGIAAIVGN